VRDLCAAAVDAATGAGAEYADARVVMKRNQFVATKSGRVERLSDSESEGIGVRVLLNGAWDSLVTGGFPQTAHATRPSEPAPSRAPPQGSIRDSSLL